MCVAATTQVWLNRNSKTEWTIKRVHILIRNIKETRHKIWNSFLSVWGILARCCWRWRYYFLTSCLFILRLSSSWCFQLFFFHSTHACSTLFMFCCIRWLRWNRRERKFVHLNHRKFSHILPWITTWRIWSATEWIELDSTWSGKCWDLLFIFIYSDLSLSLSCIEFQFHL